MAGNCLKLMQVNIAGPNQRLASLKERIGEIVALVDQHEIEIVAVQAGVDADGNDAPLTALGAALSEHGQVATAGGIALLTKVPMADARAVPLRQLGLPDDPFERELLIVELAPDGPVIAIGHFSWADKQAEANVADTLGALSGMGDVLLVGDFNQPPESAALAAFAEAGFVDCWPRLNRARSGFSYPAPTPDRRIDYVLERAEAPMVTALDLVAGGFSDHAALIARIER
ncbi:endonuclease/exonuclease/phosphatase family protein [Sphingomonas sp.]|jgi:endonuclease/exonuclease/phosphatase family metal-dependent hydrolase|uniref:endonuclease/exonuclease/phosphatase family protein n=1 Tax=Sphingomonas sp. TaxID=28214 RepID=UPI00343B0B7C